MPTISPASPVDWAWPDMDGKALVRRCVEEACNRRNLDILDTVLSPSYRVPGRAPDLASGTAAVKSFLSSVHDALPDARWVIEEEIADGTAVMTRLCVYGTHRGPLCGIAPTGKQVTVSAIIISHVVHQQIVGHWAQIDLLSLLDQLGVLPDMGLEKVVAVAHLLHVGAQLMGGDATMTG